MKTVYAIRLVRLTAATIPNKLYESLKLLNLRHALYIPMQKAAILDICIPYNQKVLTEEWIRRDGHWDPYSFENHVNWFELRNVDDDDDDVDDDDDDNNNNNNNNNFLLMWFWFVMVCYFNFATVSKYLFVSINIMFLYSGEGVHKYKRSDISLLFI
jgi:hypothetical protein